MAVIDLAARTGITGGAIHDALIAATVLHAGATLVTRDERARLTYERMRVPYRLLD